MRAGSPHPRPRLLTPEEFENDRVPEPLVDRMIYPFSTHLITGASKAGKSWMAYQLLMAVRAGSPFLDLKTTQARVLLLSLEMTAGLIRDRMREIADDVGMSMPKVDSQFRIVAPTTSYVPKLDLGTSWGLDHLKSLIGETEAELVLFDTLYRFHPQLDSLSNQEMGFLFDGLNEIAQSTAAALVFLDHVAKGEQLVSTAQSAIGAQVKGGATRVIIGLQRVSREKGGRWKVDVESHFGSWDEPLYYTRPRREDGSPGGGGCVRCDAVTGRGLSPETVERLFLERGERNGEDQPYFRSKRHMTEVLIAAGHARGNADASQIISAVLREMAVPAEQAQEQAERPIVTTKGDRNARVMTWRGSEEGEEP